MLQPSNNQSPIATAPAYVVLLVLCCALFLNSRNYSSSTLFLLQFCLELLGCSRRKKMSFDRLQCLFFCYTFFFFHFTLYCNNKKNYCLLLLKRQARCSLIRQWGNQRLSNKNQMWQVDCLYTWFFSS